ncbi:uncharacterized protein LOC122663075 [Telopea speciosissima]|uniref:uncharacterized protein LOC122663075 n=1 Tax=Telopea speciosissima TaxID=54955 RepID=UPI001CC4B985|nr:uncharacterized protein LOC122663075 [Telopea speciosissima]
MKPTAINEFLLQKYHIQLPYQRIYRARRIIQEINEGSYSKFYARLPAYDGLVLEKNLGSKFIIEYESRQEHELDTVDPVFLRVFICFCACARDFLKGCTPFLGIDGCHLKGRYDGVLLSAISVDGNKGLFPVAYTVVEVECKESWLFFLNHLHDVIDPEDTKRLLNFMSDKQKGLADVEFEINAIKSMDTTIYEWLIKDPKKLWARHAFDVGPKSEYITNNMTYSFNQWISAIRTKPILTLIDALRLKLMDRMYHKFHKGQSFYGTITPMVRKKLIKIQETSRDCISHGGADDEFEVIELGGRREMFHPLDDLADLREDGPIYGVVQSPRLRRIQGRPQKSRRKDPDEALNGESSQRSTSLRCSKCNMVSHNKRKCKRPPMKDKRASSSQTVGVKVALNSIYSSLVFSCLLAAAIVGIALNRTVLILNSDVKDLELLGLNPDFTLLIMLLFALHLETGTLGCQNV